MVTAKHVINASSGNGSKSGADASDSARAALASAGPLGLATVNSDVCVLEEHRVVVRRELTGGQRKVALVSSGSDRFMSFKPENACGRHKL